MGSASLGSSPVWRTVRSATFCSMERRHLEQCSASPAVSLEGGRGAEAGLGASHALHVRAEPAFSRVHVSHIHCSSVEAEVDAALEVDAAVKN